MRAQVQAPLLHDNPRLPELIHLAEQLGFALHDVQLKRGVGQAQDRRILLDLRTLLDIDLLHPTAFHRVQVDRRERHHRALLDDVLQEGSVGYRRQGQLPGVHVQRRSVDGEQLVGGESDYRGDQAIERDPPRRKALPLDPAVHGVVLFTLFIRREHLHQALGLFAILGIAQETLLIGFNVGTFHLAAQGIVKFNQEKILIFCCFLQDSLGASY